MIKKTIVLFMLISSYTYASGTSKLLDYLISSQGASEMVARTGLKGSDAGHVESYIHSALSAITNKKNVSKADLLDSLSKMPVTGADEKTRKELQVLLSKPENELKKEDIVKAINHMIYLANRHGKSVLITCAECVNDKIAKSGFKFVVDTIHNSSTKKLLNEVIPNNPRDLQNYITTRVRRLAVGDYSRVTPAMVLPEEEKSLALFLGLMENGSPDFKRLATSIKNLSSSKGKVNLFDASHPNKLWKIAVQDMSPTEMDTWTNALEEVSVISKKEKISPEEAFYKVLKKRAEGDETLMKKFKNIKSKRCFFK